MWVPAGRASLISLNEVNLKPVWVPAGRASLISLNEVNLTKAKTYFRVTD